MIGVLAGMNLIDRYISMPLLPLRGIRVLDCSRVLAGPYATQLLGDLGAEIIKVEKPNTGDDTRSWHPPLDKKSQLSAYFIAANRNKKSITVNMKHPKGREILHNLVRVSDVFIENFMVGELKKYQLDYDSLKKINKGIIYASISGFGQTGPKKNLPGYDFAIQAASGLMSITGPPKTEPNSKPYKVGTAISDTFTGMYAVTGILASIIHRMRNPSGEGQHIDLSLFDVTLSFLANQATNYLVSNKSPERLGNAHPNIAPYELLEVRNGNVVICVGNDKQFEMFCKIIGAEELAKDEKFKTNPSRVANRVELISKIESKLKLKDMKELLPALEAAKIPCSPVNDIGDAFREPQVQERKMLWKIPNREGEVVTVGNPLKFSETKLDECEHLPPPKLGEHTEQVLRDLLKMSTSEIDNLKRVGAI